jgi:hypothetical protein
MWQLWPVPVVFHIHRVPGSHLLPRPGRRRTLYEHEKLAHCPESNPRGLCTECVQEAVALDNQEKWQGALDNYMRALEFFSLHCKYDNNPASRETIQNKMREYLDRAEYLKTVVNRNTKTDDSGDATTAVGQAKKPSVRSLPLTYSILM